MTMHSQDSSGSYSPLMKTVHWTTVAIILALLYLGWIMGDLAGNDPWRGTYYMLHKSLGALVLFLTLFRLACRIVHGAPPLPPTLKSWEIFLSGLVHKLLYACLIVQPLTGWALSTVAKRPVIFFGLFPLPGLPFVQAIQDTGVLWNIHSTVASILACLFILHAGAALKHHFLDRDSVLLRMVPAAFEPLLRSLRGER